MQLSAYIDNLFYILIYIFIYFHMIFIYPYMQLSRYEFSLVIYITSFLIYIITYFDYHINIFSIFDYEKEQNISKTHEHMQITEYDIFLINHLLNFNHYD